MRKYVIKDSKGVEYTFRRIGAHHFAPNCFAGGMISAYPERFDNEDLVNIQGGLGDIRNATIGNIKEAYEILRDVVKERKPETIFEKCECVMETVNRYFGNYSNVKNRLSFYPADDDDMEEGKVSDLAHQNAAICVERAMLSQNLLKDMGIDSIFKIAGFINNSNNNDAHAFNVIKDGEKYYIYDSTQPTLREGIISPIVAEIPKEVYDELIKPRSNDGISVRVSHYNPMVDMDYDVVYDAHWKRMYDARGSLDKDKQIS